MPGVNTPRPCDERRKVKQKRDEYGPMTPEACEASFAQAETFFPRHFPELAFLAFCSNTWLFDGQLAKLLPKESNIVQFQRCFSLLPAPNADDQQTLERVFGGPVKDWSDAPCNSSLQRALAEFALAGGRFRTGYGYRRMCSTPGYCGGVEAGSYRNHFPALLCEAIALSFHYSCNNSGILSCSQSLN
jgi:hypothetical protein